MYTLNGNYLTCVRPVNMVHMYLSALQLVQQHYRIDIEVHSRALCGLVRSHARQEGLPLSYRASLGML